ncbi:hypothetical protein LHJ74_18180 [Streptomyces sp. N2-109]|uniref:Lipoprotein n=1 Tax=Streptomyces gossypii TaxID=2883101 RepID=A0ABT2JV97_9ACTN|nr:hypothetical protein [Streptomyces gossypii]MCT2591801.1 hypothetical protein [Streptomyces gossypii]
MPPLPGPSRPLTRRTVAAALLLGGGVAACSEGGAAAGPTAGGSDAAPTRGSPSTGSPPVQPPKARSSSPDAAPDASPNAAELVSLQISGGYAGVDRRIHVRTDGRYTATERGSQGTAEGRKGRLTDARLARLRDLLRDARLHRRSPQAVDPSLRDQFRYRITYGDHVVVTDLSDPVKPLAEAIGLLEQAIGD